MYRLEVDVKAPKKLHPAFEIDCTSGGSSSSIPTGSVRLRRGVLAQHMQHYTTADRPQYERHYVPFLPMQRTCSLFLFAAPSTFQWRDLTESFFQGPKPQIARYFSRLIDKCEDVEDLAVTLRDYMDPFDFYSAVLIFDDQRDADSFFVANHGRIFPTQALEVHDELPEAPTGGPCCYLTFIESITYGCSEKLDDPKQWHLIPACPFCLERIDGQATGVVTHPHGWLSLFDWDSVPNTNCCAACNAISLIAISIVACIDGAGGVNTPVESVGTSNLPLAAADNSTQNVTGVCAVCGVSDGLWVCLCCGNLGCGRYARAHAKDHALHDGLCHRFCLEIGTGRIWDYVGDVFVHRRLVQMVHQGETEKFEVALPFPAAGQHGEGVSDDHLSMEFDVILAAQLDFQRQFFEERRKAIEKQCQQTIMERIATVEQANESLSQLHTQCHQAAKDLGKASKAHSKCALQASELEQNISILSEANRSLMQSMAKAPALPQEDKVVARLQKELEGLLLQLEA